MDNNGKIPGYMIFASVAVYNMYLLYALYNEYWDEKVYLICLLLSIITNVYFLYSQQVNFHHLEQLIIYDWNYITHMFYQKNRN